MSTAETRALIDEAKAKLVSKPKASKTNAKAIEANDANTANALLAQRSELYDAKKKLEAELAEIDAIIKDMIGNNDELHVHGAKVASIARWKETSLITDKVKELFPLTEFPDIYKRISKSRMTIH
jgi:phage shock protein A